MLKDIDLHIDKNNSHKCIIDEEFTVNEVQEVVSLINSIYNTCE